MLHHRLLQRRHFTLAALSALAVPPWVAAQAKGGGDLADRLRAGRCAVLWRHAQTTSGVGDPEGFDLLKCSTQRNLSDEGRAQSRSAGAWFKARGLDPREVRSSAWCRCKDTADLAFGRHDVWTPLNSFFDDRSAAGLSRTAMRERLAMIPAGAFEVWVTHQVNITGLTDEVPSMGEAVVVDGSGKVATRGFFR